ncbi:MAG: GntR family transcriptional regulator [Anaerolineales bacterium]|nr:GntR family transcriptional regulator [Anaerolineales bacterium]
MASRSVIVDENEFIQKRPLKEDIFDVLHDKIVSGKYKPGEWLRQDEIATQLGVSMTPVREGLDLLVASGLAERVPYRGVRVREIVTKDVVEAYGLRLALEAIVAQEAAKHIRADQIARLERTIAESKKHNSLKEMSTARKLSREFHTAIAEASGNDLLVRLYGVVANAFPDWILYEAMFRKPEILADSMTDMHREHTDIVKALKAGDGTLAARLSVEHVIVSSGRWLEKYSDIPADLLREKEEEVAFLMKK